jgi:hypothetical protein
MKPQTLVGVISAIFVGCLGMAALRAQNGQGNDQGGDDSRIQVGFKYAHDQGISLDLKGKNRALVGLGSYLVNGVGGCNDCHTAPPYTQDPYAGLGAPKQVNVACYLAGGQEFGPFVSRDITPWENNKPAGLTLKHPRHTNGRGPGPSRPGATGHAVARLSDHDGQGPHRGIRVSVVDSADPGQHLRRTERIVGIEAAAGKSLSGCHARALSLFRARISRGAGPSRARIPARGHRGLPPVEGGSAPRAHRSARCGH